MDASLYLQTAANLLAGEGYTYLGQPFSLRPPGFPILLAPVLARWGTDPVAINTCVSLFGVLAVGLLFAFVRKHLGDVLGVAVAVAIWINPTYRDLCNSPMSDVPGLALLLAALLADRWARRGGRVGREVLTGALIAAATYVRSVSFLLVPAILLSRLLAGRRPGWVRRGAVLAVVAVALVLPWQVRNRLRTPDAPADQTWLHSQWTAVWHTDEGDPSSPRISLAEHAARIRGQTAWTVYALGKRLQVSHHRHTLGFGLFVVASLLLAAGRRRDAGDLFAVLFGAVLCFWHASLIRLALLVHVFAFPAAAWIVHAVGRRLGARRAGEWLVAAAVLALAVHDARDGVDWEAEAREHREALRRAALLRERIPGDAVVATDDDWWKDAVLLGRPVHSLGIAAKRAGAAGVRDVLDRYGIDTVLYRGPRDGAIHALLRDRYSRAAEIAGIELLVRDPPTAGPDASVPDVPE